MSSEVVVTGEEAREELEAGDGVEQQRGGEREKGNLTVGKGISGNA